MISFSDYYPFGSIMPMRSSSLDKYRYGFNGQEKENSVNGSYSTTSAEFWMYDGRLGRRWNLDPKPNESISMYAAFQNNPIFYFDPLGDTVKYDKFRDRANVFFTKIFNKDFRIKHNERKESSNVYTYKSGGDAQKFLESANEEVVKANYSGHFLKNLEFDVNYNERELTKGLHETFKFIGGVGYTIGSFAWSIGKIPVGLTLGLAWSFGRMIFSSDHEFHWGMAGFASFGTRNGPNVFSFGFGDWESYNMWGQNIDMGKLRGYNMSGLLGLRWSGGNKTRINFIDIGPMLEGEFYDHYIHFNLAPKKLRREYLKREDRYDTRRQ